MDPVVNFGKVTVLGGYTTETEVILITGDGSKLPNPADPAGSFNLVWFDSSTYPDPADDPNVEIVRCTARVGDTLTLTRAQEGTSASTKNTPDKIYKMILTLTKKTIDDIRMNLMTKVTNIWLVAEAAYFPATNPATFNEVAGTTTYAGWSYLAFNDTIAQTAVWRVPVPGYNGGGITVKAFSKPQITPGENKTLQYDILTIGLANDENFNTAALVDTNVNISHSLGTGTLSTEVHTASATIYPANVEADDLLVIGIRRDVVSGNLIGDAQLLGILLEYTRYHGILY